MNRGRRVIVIGTGIQVLGDHHADVQTAQIGGANRGAARPANDRAGQCIDDIGCQAQIHHLADRFVHAVDTDTVRHESGHVFGHNNTLAQNLVAETRDVHDHLRVGCGCWNHLEQFQVARRVEKVRANKTAFEICAATLDLQVHWNAARVAAHNRCLRDERFDLCPERLFDLQPLEDRLENPIAIAQFFQVILEISNLNQFGATWVHERGRTGFQGLLEASFRKLIAVFRVWQNNVQEQDGNSGIGKVGGNGGSHRARANNGGFTDFHGVS